MSDISAPSPRRVYCAGPLFNQSERAEMTDIAERLCAAGYEVYLPHRDGMEFRHVLDELIARGWPSMITGRDNPLLAGLVDFDLLVDKQHITAALARAIDNCHSSPLGLSILPPSVQKAVGQGSLLWTAMQNQSAQGDNFILADVVAELFAPPISR